MKKFLILSFALASLSSCSILRNESRKKFDWMYPGKAMLKGKTPCKLSPKPLFKN